MGRLIKSIQIYYFLILCAQQHTGEKVNNKVDGEILDLLTVLIELEEGGCRQVKREQTISGKDEWTFGRIVGRYGSCDKVCLDMVSTYSLLSYNELILPG